MQTPSHLIVTAALRYGLGRHSLPLHTPALLIGSVLPDIPFALLSIVYELYYRITGIAVPAPSIMEYLHFDLFFNDPLWIVSHNTFHSLLVNGLLLAIGYWQWRHGRRWGLWLFWLAASMLFHTTIDIFTHNSDGPLFLFPLNWTYRFASPISYWETAYFGRAFLLFEYTLDAVLLLYMGWRWRMEKAR